MAVTAGTLMLVGCTGGPDGDTDTGARKPSGRSSGTTGEPGSAPSSSGPYTVAEDRAPATRAEAVEFVRELPARHFTAVARRIAERPEDAVLFAGLRPERAASLDRALREAGHRGARVADEPVLGGRFLAEAEGWMVGTAYADAGADPRLRTFAAAHRELHGDSPAPWAAEAYDAVRFAAHGLTEAGDDGPSALRSELLRAPWQGVTRRFSYDPGGQFYDADRDGGSFLYRISGGAHFVARADDIGDGGG
ncbi:hypothetical protein GCM10010285_38150 [Streptomyces pseudogriseolus]|uniref:Leucine-binding protein domain-containing protein n=1 Tax=Streptomyces pseudogriseolus TaxID=36817 RepID=A0ABQ2T6T5_STREZ|nr:hypothetical protein GCM10010285_38150 [Streptomyces rubiginosus]